MRTKYKLELKVSSYTILFLFKNTENVKFMTSQIQTAKKGIYVNSSCGPVSSEHTVPGD